MSDVGVDSVEGGAGVVEAILNGEEVGEETEVEPKDVDPDSAFYEETETEPEESGDEEADADSDSEDAGEDDDEPEEDEEELKEEEPKQKGGRAQKRIQELVKERDAARQEAQQQMQQMQYQLQIEQQKFQHQLELSKRETQSQLTSMQQALESVRQMQPEKEETPVEKLKREAVEEARKLLANDLEPLRAQQKQYEEERRRVAKEQERARIHREFEVETEGARNDLLTGFIPDDATKLAPRADDFILTFAAASGVRPTEAKAQAQKFLEDYVAARDRARAQKRKAKVEKSKSVPKARRAGRAGAGGKGSTNRPPLAKLQTAGYQSYLDWREAGAPSVE